MHRALGPLVVAATLCTGCRSASPAPPASVAPASVARVSRDPCLGTSQPVLEPSTRVPNVEPEWDARVTRVAFRGQHQVPEAILERTVQTRPGSVLDPAQIQKDVRALMALEAIERVSVETDDSVVTYVVRERRRVGEIVWRGIDPDRIQHGVPLAEGQFYDPARLVRLQNDLEQHLMNGGHAQAKVEVHQISIVPDRVGICFVVDAGPRFLIDRIRFSGNEHATEAELRPLVASNHGRFNQLQMPYHPGLLKKAEKYLLALYYDRGFLDVVVREPRVTFDPALGLVSVEIAIHEGPIYRVRSIEFKDSESKLRKCHARFVQKGDIFVRTRMLEGLACIRELYAKEGREVKLAPELDGDDDSQQVSVTIRIVGDAQVAPR